ncbi:MAG: hypothetical protein H6855_01310 [Rhodospirillales bacterium]|nr:hypothetical protein [Rhodospirillales bacterium]MCB9964708.1 hypothetical protein [Rhodospirillales bacterium]MCB9980068.1 hypothetical protein [Rhodospirillales bacterium]
MQHFILTYWPIISFSLLHVVSFIWSFSSLTGRVHTLERELENYKNVHERLARLEATSATVAESIRRIEAHLLRMKSS